MLALLSISENVLRYKLEYSVWTSTGGMLWTLGKGSILCWVKLEVIFWGLEILKQAPRTRKLREAEESRAVCNVPQANGTQSSPTSLSLTSITLWS